MRVVSWVLVMVGWKEDEVGFLGECEWEMEAVSYVERGAFD